MNLSTNFPASATSNETVAQFTNNKHQLIRELFNKNISTAEDE
jgi:hypothetical protein